MKILITGASGLIGRALTTELKTQGHTVVAAVRREPRRNDEVQWNPASGVLSPSAFDGVDAVVHLAGAGIGDKRWTDNYKKEILESRTLSTSHWQSWISITDEVNAIIHLLTSSISGPVNLTAPEPVTNADFTRTLASVVSRPAIVPIPSFGPKLLLGGELADALLFTGQRVIPSALTRDGFVFTHQTLDHALRALLKK
jgi:NAD dependent epimerase/dehydratase family enzyme